MKTNPCALAAALCVAGVLTLAVAAPSAHAAGTATGTATEIETATGTAAPSPELAALREQGVELHARAVEGDEDAAEGAVERLERYLEHHPDDGEARAWLGSAWAMRGRDAASIVNKMRYTNRGLRHLDRALDAAPRNFTVRLTRAKVNASLPAMFSRREAAVEDLRTLDAIFEADPSPGLARWMVGVYEDLLRLAPDAGPWDERLARARALAEGE